jgi:transcriptional regulator with XRE-family HTH domain
MIGDNIKKIRESRGLSMNALSKQSGISVGYLSDLEKNKKSNPTKELLDKLASALNISTQELLDDNREPDEIDKLEDEFKIMFSKMKKISPSDREKIMKMIEMFEEENRD